MRPSRPLKLAAVTNLRATWLGSKDAVTRTKGRGGVDGVSAQQFRSRLDENLHNLRTRLLDPLFEFQPLRPVFLPTKSGKDRLICIPTIGDKVIQRAIVRYLTIGDKLQIINNISYGFMRGRSVKHAAQKAQRLRREHPWALKSDIRSFFDQINREQLKSEVSRRLGRSSVVPLICRAIDTEVRTSEESERRRIGSIGVRPGIGLRQGMPLSPLLSNVVLRRFDTALIRAGLCVVRYADDFLILCDSEAACHQALSLVKARLAERGHVVAELGPGSKTQIHRPDEAVEFLGVEIALAPNGGMRNYRIRVPQEAFERASTLASLFQRFDEVAKKWPRMTGALQSLDAKLGGMVNAYEFASNVKDFEAHARNCRGNAIRILLASMFGSEAVSRMNAQHLAFLGIAGEEL